MLRDPRKRGAARFSREIERWRPRHRVVWCLPMVSCVMVIAVMVTAVNVGASARGIGPLRRVAVVGIDQRSSREN